MQISILLCPVPVQAIVLPTVTTISTATGQTSVLMDVINALECIQDSITKLIRVMCFQYIQIVHGEFLEVIAP